MTRSKSTAEKSTAEKLAEQQSASVVRQAPDEEARAKAAREHAAARRDDYVRGLTEELDMCKAAGKADRVKAIEAEIKRVKAVQGRSAPEGDEA